MRDVCRILWPDAEYPIATPRLHVLIEVVLKHGITFGRSTSLVHPQVARQVATKGPWLLTWGGTSPAPSLAFSQSGLPDVYRSISAGQEAVFRG